MLSSITNRAVAVLDAGIAGLVANAVAASYLIGPDRFALLLVPWHYLVAIATTSCLPLIYCAAKKPFAHVLSLGLLIAVPLAMTEHLSETVTVSMPILMLLSGVYAIVALSIYRLVRHMTR